MNKGDIFELAESKQKGFKNSRYFYCKGNLDNESIMVECIITQSGEILISNEIVDISQYKNFIEKTSIEKFLINKLNFKENTHIDFIPKGKYSDGIIREIDDKKNKLLIEVEDIDTYQYKEIWINFKDVKIVYPEYAFNKRRKFNTLK